MRRKDQDAGQAWENRRGEEYFADGINCLSTHHPDLGQCEIPVIVIPYLCPFDYRSR